MEWLNGPIARNSVGDRTIVVAPPMTELWRRTDHGLMRDHGDRYGRAVARAFTVEVNVAGPTPPSTT